jgi:hypothetical protein
MSNQPRNSPLGAFLAALREEKIDCILIGAMAAIEQGAPLGTIDYDFWVRLPERQYVRLLTIVKRQGGSVLARTLDELSDGKQVNAIFAPEGLKSFRTELKTCHLTRLEGEPVRVLPLARVIASKRAASREKDLAVLPILERTLRLQKRLTAARRFKQKSPSPRGHARRSGGSRGQRSGR